MPRCEACSYDLAGLGSVHRCPECGCHTPEGRNALVHDPPDWWRELYKRWATCKRLALWPGWAFAFLLIAAIVAAFLATMDAPTRVWSAVLVGAGAWLVAISLAALLYPLRLTRIPADQRPAHAKDLRLTAALATVPQTCTLAAVVPAAYFQTGMVGSPPQLWWLIGVAVLLVLVDALALRRLARVFYTATALPGKLGQGAPVSVGGLVLIGAVLVLLPANVFDMQEIQTLPALWGVLVVCVAVSLRVRWRLAETLLDAIPTPPPSTTDTSDSPEVASTDTLPTEARNALDADPYKHT